MPNDFELSEELRRPYREMFAIATEDNEVLDRLIVSATFSLLDRDAELARYERLLALRARLIEVRDLYKRKPDITDKKWPEIVAGCVRVYRADHGQMPGGGDLPEIVRDALEIPDETAATIVKRTCHGHSHDARRFHVLWMEIARGEPGLREQMAAVR